MVFGPDLKPSPSPPAEGFAELIKAARVLLREHVTGEDQIILTLAAAYQIDRGMGHWTAAKETVIRRGLKHVPQRFPGSREVRVVKVVSEILLLEWEPIAAELVWDLIFSGMVWEGASSQLVSRSWKEDGSEPLASRWKSRPPGWRSMTDQARSDRAGVLIRVYPHKRAIQPKEVAARYQDVLKATELPFGGPRAALVEYEFWNGCLYLLVAAGEQQSRGEISFPSASFVEIFSHGVLQEFRDRLAARKAGPKMNAEKLIPACVAFFLRASGRMDGRVEIERLLNDHVHGTEKYLPGSSVSENVQLWRDVEKAQRLIVRVLPRI